MEQTAASNTPTPEWPGAFGLYKTAKRVTRVNLNTLIMLYVISVVISLILSIALGRNLQWVGQVISFLVGTLITGATTATYLRSLSNTKINTDAVLQIGLKRYVDVFLLFILMYIAAIVSFVLLIIPFFFVFPRLLLAPYFLIDKDMNAMEALKESWRVSKGNVGKVYGIIGANIVYCLLFVTIIGIPFAIYFLVMYSSASALLYRQITTGDVAFETKQA